MSDKVSVSANDKEETSWGSPDTGGGINSDNSCVLSNLGEDHDLKGNLQPAQPTDNNSSSITPDPNDPNDPTTDHDLPSVTPQPTDNSSTSITPDPNNPLTNYNLPSVPAQPTDNSSITPDPNDPTTDHDLPSVAPQPTYNNSSSITPDPNDPNDPLTDHNLPSVPPQPTDNSNITPGPNDPNNPLTDHDLPSVPPQPTDNSSTSITPDPNNNNANDTESQKSIKPRNIAEVPVEVQVRPKDIHDEVYVAQQRELQHQIIQLLPEIHPETLVLATGRLNIDEFARHADGFHKVISELNRKVYYGDLEEYQHKWKSSLEQERGFELLTNREIQAAQHNASLLQKILSSDALAARKTDRLTGYTLLHWACKAANVESMAMLIDHQGDVNARSFGGHTPLHLAAMSGSTRALELLLRNGARVNTETFDGVKPRDLVHGDAKYFLQTKSICLEYNTLSRILSKRKSYN